MSRFPGEARPAVLACLDRVETALDEAADAAWFGLSAEDTAAVVRAATRLASRLQAVALQGVAHVEATGLADAVGATSTGAWLAGACRLRPTETPGLVKLARQLHAHPRTGAALAAGAVNVEQARVVVQAVDHLPVAVRGDVRDRAEGWLLDQAAQHDAAALANLGRAVLEVVDPEEADRLLGKQLDRADRRDRAGRHLHVLPIPGGPDVDDPCAGGAVLRGRLDAEATAQLLAVLDPLAAPRPTADDGPDPRTGGERMADALQEACRRLLAAGDQLPTHGGDPTTVLVTMPLAALTDQLQRLDDLKQVQTPFGEFRAPADAKGEPAVARYLRTGEPVGPATARRLACDAAIVPAVLGGASVPLDLGRTERLFTGPVRKALELRDQGCAFPGCQRPPAWCHGHHIREWIFGGETTLQNGVLLCGHHHRVIHQGEWSVEPGPDGHPWFRPPAWIDPQRSPRRNHRAPPVPAAPSGEAQSARGGATARR